MKQHPMRRKVISLNALLATAHQLSLNIPGCEHLNSKEYVDNWVYVNSYDDYLYVDDVKKDIRQSIVPWLHSVDDNQIVETIRWLPILARNTLYWVVPIRFKHFFEPIYKGFPNDFAVPNPFRCISPKQEDLLNLRKPLILRSGKTIMKIQGTALKAEDGQLTYGLLKVMRTRRTARYTEKNIMFECTLTEIAKAMLKTNPYAKSTREAIWKGLERLRACAITLTNYKGLRTLGGILDGAIELDEKDKDGIIKIYLDRNFIDLIDEGYPALGDIYLELPAVAANLFVYLNRQRSFNSSGYLEKRNIEKVYEAAGLSFDPSSEPLWYKRRRLKDALNKLKKVKVIKYYKIENGKLTISDLGQLPALPTPSDLEQLHKDISRPATSGTKSRCPSGYRFGTDYLKYDECEMCGVAEECEDANLHLDRQTETSTDHNGKKVVPFFRRRKT